MIWNTWSDFFRMGGYALYVWGSFGVTAILVVGEVVLLREHADKALEQARRAVKFAKVVEPEAAVEEDDEETA
jgi:heme exporter protein D